MEEDEASPLATVLRYIGHINEGERAAIAAMTSPDVKFTDYGGDVYYEEEFMQNYLANYPEYRIHIDHALTGGNGVAIVGRTSGSHLAAEVEKREILVWTAEVNDGLIREWRIYRGWK